MIVGITTTNAISAYLVLVYLYCFGDFYVVVCIVLIKIRGSQEPVIARLVFNLTSKVDRKWGCYT
jgi:hypothetical protein